MKIDDEFEKEIARDTKPSVNKDKLEFVRNQVRAMRDLDQSIADAEERVRSLNKQKLEMEMVTLPELYAQLRINSIGLDAEGNQPAYNANLQDYYRANIKADWPIEKREEAFAWLEEQGLGDIIKSVITIEIALGEEKLRDKVVKLLQKSKIPDEKISEARMVPWNTLTAAVKEMHKDGRHFDSEEMDLLGATIGKIVKLMPKKER